MRWQLLRPSRQSVRVALWLGGVSALLLALLLRNPLFLIWRSYATPFVFAGPVAVLAAGGWRWRAAERRPPLALLALWLAVLAVAASQYGVFAWRKHEVLTAPDAEARRLGAHMIVGYTDPGTVKMLAGKGLIGGVFVSSHNVLGRSPAAIRAQIDTWQAARRAAGLPPLIVSTDQEGGIVSRMSPPLSPMPSLAEVIANARDDEIDLLAFAYGERHGRELAALGINVNFAPLADLATATTRHRFDFRSLIGRRAIDTDPGRVTPAVIGYAHGLEAHGVRATLKHFPGLGRVDADTHIVPATLAASERDLDARDWVPFRAGLRATQSLLMVGHATLPAIDAARPASRSAKVIDGVVRRRWGHDGLLVTDDLTMGAIVRQGLCSAGVDAINAGIDLLLVSYDADQYYEIFHCLLQASRAGKLASGKLAASDRRLNALHASFRHAPGSPKPIRAETPTAPRAGRNPAFSLVCASGCGIIPGLPARASPLPDG
jgi:beta-N-acetylhexosaminidase